MSRTTSYVRWSAVALVMTVHGTAQADNIFGGKNSIFNNPGQITGGKNSVINNPGQLTGGSNSIINNPAQLSGGPNSVINNPGQVTQGIANALNELQASVLTGPTLERAIIESRNTAINGSMPIPDDVRRAMSGYISEDSLNRARYKIGDSGFVNLAHLIEQGGRADAVTLVDVIIFRGPSEANDLSTWAHELTHVGQYAEWGVHSFAVQYARNWRSVEDPAYAKGDGFAAWYNQKQSNMPAGATPPNTLPATYTPPAANMQPFGAFCYTRFGRFGPGPIQPQGNPCVVTLPQGNVPGQVGP
jgi:Domain of unknown function (DUF4157)